MVEPQKLQCHVRKYFLLPAARVPGVGVGGLGFGDIWRVTAS